MHRLKVYGLTRPIESVTRFCWKRAHAVIAQWCWKHGRAAAAHPEHYAVAIIITVALILIKHLDVAALWVLWLDKLLTSVVEG